MTLSGTLSVVYSRSMSLNASRFAAKEYRA